MTAPLLETRNLGKRFRGLVANSGIDFRLFPASSHCIIGPNGAGKTTFLSMISGHLSPTEGEIRYRDTDVTRRSVVYRARHGIARKFQTPSVFPELTVWQNMELPAMRVERSRRRVDERVQRVLEQVRLWEDRQVAADHLSHGQRQWLEVGMLVAMNAQLLLLDEPAAGMTKEEKGATATLVHELVGGLGLATIVIEHDMDFVRLLDTRVTVLHMGSVLTEGAFDDVANDERVRDVYLGNQS
jgi:ABC-type uncharacterized transport system ATPase subunit